MIDLPPSNPFKNKIACSSTLRLRELINVMVIFTACSLPSLPAMAKTAQWPQSESAKQRVELIVGEQNKIAFKPADVPGSPAAEVIAELISPTGGAELLSISPSNGEEALVDLGPLLAGPTFSYEDGIVRAKGYQIRLHRGVPSQALVLSQAPNSAYRPWRFGAPITQSTITFDSRGWDSRHFNPALSTGTMLLLRLDEAALLGAPNPDVLLTLSPVFRGDSIKGFLKISDTEGKTLHEEAVELKRKKELRVDLKLHTLGEGHYQIAFHPEVEGKVYENGPSISYNKQAPRTGVIQLSPYAPWTLKADANRPKLLITDFVNFPDATIPRGWSASGGKGGIMAKTKVDEVILHPNLTGEYALFATALGRGCYIQVGDGLPLRIRKGERERVYVTTAELAGKEIKIYGFDVGFHETAGLESLELLPTNGWDFSPNAGSSSKGSLVGINDWCEYFWDSTRVAPDQIQAIIEGQKLLGIERIEWSVARSWVEYHSDLPTTSLFPCVPYEQVLAEHPKASLYEGRIKMMHADCPLRSALAHAQSVGVELGAWIGLNSHYGEQAYGGMFASPWYVEHPEFRRWRKGAAEPERGAVGYFFPEVRAERIAILREVAEIGTKEVMVDGTRQFPMFLYEPAMVAEYHKLTGIDPTKIDASDGEQYQQWTRWRSSFFTEFLVEARAALAGTGARLILRVPSVSLSDNLAFGFDVEAICKAQLIDSLHLNPLEEMNGNGLSSLSLYLQLADRYKIPLVGGIGATWMRQDGIVPALRRASSLLNASMAGIDLYESEMLAQCSNIRWVAPLFRTPDIAEAFLKQSNIEACYPVRPETAILGNDNHSRWLGIGWRTTGFDQHSL